MVCYVPPLAVCRRRHVLTPVPLSVSQEGSLPYGESVLRGPRLEIGQVAPAHRGTYLCTVTTANNRTEVRTLQLRVNCE